MKALIADQQLVTELLPMGGAIDVMRRALTMLAAFPAGFGSAAEV
jgi:hypothetical protein